MAKTVTIRLTGLAEKFMAEMKSQGLNEADVISQGIGILEEIWRTGRVALVKKDFWERDQKFPENPMPDHDYDRILEHYYRIQTPEAMGISKR